MRLTRIITTMNWRYAIGEVLLIVVGISIALGANSWYENRKERADERAVLQQLSESLQVDLDNFEEHRQSHVDQEGDIIRLVEHMEGAKPYGPEMSSFFRSVKRWREVRSNTAPYETLKSRGLDMVVSADLRSKIVYYYENRVQSQIRMAMNDREFVTDSINPYIDRNFYYIDTVALEPLNYEALRKDVYFRNLCLAKLFRLQNYILPSYQITNKMIRELLDDIDTELNRS